MKRLPILLIALMSGACTHTVVTLPDGTRIDRRAFLTRETLGPITASKSPAETPFSLGAVSKDQTDVANRAIGLAETMLGGRK